MLVHWWLATSVVNQDLLGPPLGRGSCDVTFWSSVTRADKPGRDRSRGPPLSRFRERERGLSAGSDAIPRLSVYSFFWRFVFDEN